MKINQPGGVFDKKQLHQALDRLHREVESNREGFLKLRKEYDKYTIHENLFVKNNEVHHSYKANVKKRLESLAERYFGDFFLQTASSSKSKK